MTCRIRKCLIALRPIRWLYSLRYVPGYSKCASGILTSLRLGSRAGSLFAPLTPSGPHSVRYSATLRSYSGFVEARESGDLLAFLIPIKRSS